MACKWCKEKKPEIEQHVSIVIDNGIRKYSFPKWGLIVEWKTMLEALEKAREIMKNRENSEWEKE